MRRRLAALALLVGPPMVALAQSPSIPTRGRATGYREIPQGWRVVAPFDLTVEQLDDTEIHTDAGELVGEIAKVLMDADGRPVAVTVEVLEPGWNREHIILIERLRRDGIRLVTDLTRAQVARLPLWN